jgi:hypothetical protein
VGPQIWFVCGGEEFLYIPYSKVAERRGRFVNTPASYSEDPGFKFRPEDRLS